MIRSFAMDGSPVGRTPAGPAHERKSTRDFNYLEI
jgi:hypothetical protein